MTELRTPYFLIDESRLLANLEVVDRLRDRSGALVVLALKCFSAWSTFPLLRQHLDGTTSSSPFEVRLGFEEFTLGVPRGEPRREVHAYSVGFSAEEVAEVAPLSDKVVFNSVGQLRRHHHLVGDAEVGLRVNPGFSTSHYDLADPARRRSRLGATDDAEVKEVASLLDGAMFHFNCENDDVDDLCRSIDALGERYGWLFDQLRWVSLGGGIAFTTPGYDVDALADALRRLAERFDVQVYLEPGEAVVTGAAELVTTVLDVVCNDADIAVVDASVEAHLLDHLIYATSPPLTAPAAGGHAVTIAGRTCLAGDVFGDYHLGAPLEVGDEVRFGDAAGYSMVKTTWFNGVTMPTIAVRRLDGGIDVVRRFGYDDFKRSLS